MLFVFILHLLVWNDETTTTTKKRTKNNNNTITKNRWIFCWMKGDAHTRCCLCHLTCDYTELICTCDSSCCWLFFFVSHFHRNSRYKRYYNDNRMNERKKKKKNKKKTVNYQVVFWPFGYCLTWTKEQFGCYCFYFQIFARHFDYVNNDSITGLKALVKKFLFFFITRFYIFLVR